MTAPRLPRAIHIGIRLALSSLYRELALILERTNGFWFRFFQLGSEGRELAALQEKNIRGIQIWIAHTLVAFRWDLFGAQDCLAQINKRMEDLTNADNHAYLRRFFSIHAIRQWDNSGIGQEINRLDEMYLKWFDLCWMGAQVENETRDLVQTLPQRIDDLISIVKFIENERRSFRDWFVDFWAWLTNKAPSSYTKTIIDDLKRAKLETDAIDCTKQVKSAIRRWKSVIAQSPLTERVKRWQWVRASFEKLFAGLGERLEYEMTLPGAAVVKPRNASKLFYFERDKDNHLKAVHQPVPSKTKCKRGPRRYFLR